MQSCTDSPSSLNIHQVVAEPKLSNTDPSFVTVHKIGADGSVRSVKYELDNVSRRISAKSQCGPEASMLVRNFDESYYSEEYFAFPERFLFAEDAPVTIIKLENCESVTPDGKRELKIPNIPTMIVCQNCDTNFPTKYQYQRHQCEFNAEKVVLKANADLKDIDRGLRMKFDCPTCGKQFVSKNNLERHQTSHDESNMNVCEHCQKHFVSENRLRIHKENHCKKAGDISKFYRSDVAVWRCLKCSRVFATATSANRHADGCAEYLSRENPSHNSTVSSVYFAGFLREGDA